MFARSVNAHNVFFLITGFLPSKIDKILYSLCHKSLSISPKYCQVWGTSNLGNSRPRGSWSTSLKHKPVAAAVRCRVVRVHRRARCGAHMFDAS